MLTIIVPDKPKVSLWNEETEQFMEAPAIDGATLNLEHSLVSLSKWESITTRPFLGRDEKTYEDTILYIECMDLSDTTPKEVYTILTNENFKAISDYIDAKMTATTFNEPPAQPRNTGEFVTAEIIYYWMVSLNVPVEFETWHLNKLLALIKVINLKNAPAKKTGRRESINDRRALNKANRERLKTNG